MVDTLTTKFTDTAEFKRAHALADSHGETWAFWYTGALQSATESAQLAGACGWEDLEELYVAWLKTPEGERHRSSERTINGLRPSPSAQMDVPVETGTWTVQWAVRQDGSVFLALKPEAPRDEGDAVPDFMFYLQIEWSVEGRCSRESFDPHVRSEHFFHARAVARDLERAVGLERPPMLGYAVYETPSTATRKSPLESLAIREDCWLWRLPSLTWQAVIDAVKILENAGYGAIVVVRMHSGEGETTPALVGIDRQADMSPFLIDSLGTVRAIFLGPDIDPTQIFHVVKRD